MSAKLGPGESGRILRPASVLFLAMVAHAILETARDALFLAQIGADRLGWAYVAIAGTALVAVVAMRRWSKQRGARAMLLAFLLIASVGTLALAVSLTASPWAAFVLYVWTGTIATLVVPAFWLVIARDVQIGDAKKRVAAIAAGGGLGALVGSAIASLAGMVLDPRFLVVAGGVGFALAAISVRGLPAARPVATVDAAEVVEPPLGDAGSWRYAGLLLLLAVISTVTLTIGDLMFKRLMVERIPGDQLATVFGAMYTGLNIIALVIQLAVTPRLLDRIGVGSALAVLPAIVLVTSLGFVLTGAAVAVFALKLADGGMRNSVYRVVTEIMFVPLPTAVRERAKPLVEVFGQRGGQALAAAIVLVLASTGIGGTWSLAIATTVSVVLWMITVGLTRRAYVRRFRDKLDRAGIHRDTRIPELDERSIQLLHAALSSPDEREALAALDLLAERGEHIPALVLYHPSAAVVHHALSRLEGELRPDVARVLAQLVANPDPQLRAAALSASSRTKLHREQMIASLHDPEPEVRAAAIVGLAALECGKDAETALLAMRDGTTTERAALAHAIARAPSEPFRALLLQLASRREAAVIRHVLHAWEVAPELADVHALLRLLEDPHVRGDARRVFLAGGSRYFEDLLAALDDPRLPLGVRRHLPRTISRFASPLGARALVARLPREPDGATEFKILRALGRMRADDPKLAIDEVTVHSYARRATEDAVRYARLAESLAIHAPRERTPGFELLEELLLEKRQHAIERVFRALGIMFPRDDLRSLHDALVSESSDHRDAAREILEDLLPVDERTPLFAAIEGRSGMSGDRLRELYPAYSDVIAALLSDPSVSLRCVAAHHVAERQLFELRGDLVRLGPSSASELVTSAYAQALARLHV
jgi:ATP/ADP translocase